MPRPFEPDLDNAGVGSSWARASRLTGIGQAAFFVCRRPWP